jgi:hypothetical protein
VKWVPMGSPSPLGLLANGLFERLDVAVDGCHHKFDAGEIPCVAASAHDVILPPSFMRACNRWPYLCRTVVDQGHMRRTAYETSLDHPGGSRA